MSKEKILRLSQVARKLNVGTTTIVDYLIQKGFEIENKLNIKITPTQYEILSKAFASSVIDKKEAAEITIGKKNASQDNLQPKSISSIKKEGLTHATKLNAPKLAGITTIGKIDINNLKKKKKEAKIPEPKVDPSHKTLPSTTISTAPNELIKDKVAPIIDEKNNSNSSSISTKPSTTKITSKSSTLKGLTVLGKMDITKSKSKLSNSINATNTEKRESSTKKKRKRTTIKAKKTAKKEIPKQLIQGNESISEKEIQEQIKNTLAKISGNKESSKNRVKYRREKRTSFVEAKEQETVKKNKEAKILQITEFVSVNDLASLINVPVNKILSACMSLGLMTSINQRLDAETISIIADEFGYQVAFTTFQNEKDTEDIENEDDLVARPPIVTVMGHVDHGKTSLLDYIRNTSVTQKESGSITQHIGAYDVVTDIGKHIVFLDTPGHEAFTAMRARGAQVTDIVIIVVAADDSVMPQTKEAISHALAANVSLVIAINKIDKKTANPEKVKKELANIDILVESWGGKFQCQEISAKTGQGINELLEKVLLEAELLELKANPNRLAKGIVLESSLEKGKGYIATVINQTGTLKVGDIILAGIQYGKIKAMFDHNQKNIHQISPSAPAQILGFTSAPQAGDTFKVMLSEKEARTLASQRAQIYREQHFRTKKHITLDEIGRRFALGNFQDLNVIIKGDVDGSIQALSDALLKLSIEEVQINIIHKGVGQISESDILLASTSNAIVIGFQVRPSISARKLAKKEEIDIRLYSVIYDAINEIKSAIEGMLAPTIEETITGTVTVRELFKISKVGTIAGCSVTEGYLKKNNKVRLIRDGIVIFTGHINQLKRFKEDVQEVKSGYECGVSLKNFNDIKIGDTIEGFIEKEVKKTL